MPVNYSDLTISNNFIFTKVMSDKELMKELLEKILPERRISDLKVISEEKTMEEYPDVHGIRLDVYCEDENAMFDVEMQVLEKDLPEKRARYYQSIMDSSALRKGEDYRKLKDQYVSFFCLYDPFGANMMVYRFRNRTEEGTVLKDGAEKIYINCLAEEAGRYESLRPFAEYVRGRKSEDAYVKKVDRSVWMANRNPQWRKEYMYSRYYIDQAREEGKAEGKAEGTLQTVLQMYLDEKIDLPTALKYCHLSETDFLKQVHDCKTSLTGNS